MAPVDVRSSRFKAARVGSTATTIFAEMSALAIATESVNLGQGFPDYDGPAFMLAAAERAIAEGVNQYPPGRGIAPLRQAVVDHSRRHYGLAYDADPEVIITTGATEALAAAILAFVDPGDEVIALEPFYDSYAASVALAGGGSSGSGCSGRTSSSTSTSSGRRHPRTKMILVNSPHNPTGAVLGATELAAIAELGDRPGPARGLRRGVRAPGLRRRRAPAARRLPRDAGADDPDLLVGQDVLGHGVEDRLGAGPAQLITELTAVKQFLTYVSGGAVPARGRQGPGRGRRLGGRRPGRAAGQA